MLVVDYDYYTNEYKGSLTEDDFNKYIRQASISMQNYTFGRFSKLTEDSLDAFTLVAVKDCTCKIAEVLQRYEEENVSGVKSAETVGAWSVTYSKQQQARTLTNRLREVVISYLGFTDLLCSWV